MEGNEENDNDPEHRVRRLREIKRQKEAECLSKEREIRRLMVSAVIISGYRVKSLIGTFILQAEKRALDQAIQLRREQGEARRQQL